MNTLGTKTNPIMRSVKIYGSAFLIAGALVAGTGAAIHETTPHPVESTRIQQSANLPGGQAMAKDANFINVHSGYGETCAAELWMVPSQYKTVSDFLSDHPHAQPDMKRLVTARERGTCAANANLGPHEMSTYYSSVSTIETQEPEA